MQGYREDDVVYSAGLQDIGMPKPWLAPRCAWCGALLVDAWRLACGQVICDDCAAIAREVGDGAMEVQHLHTENLVADLAEPVRLRLSVRYDGAGYCALHGTPLDAVSSAIMEDLVAVDENAPGVNGVNREQLVDDLGRYALEDYDAMQAVLDRAARSGAPVDWGAEWKGVDRVAQRERYRLRLRPCRHHLPGRRQLIAVRL